MSSPCINADDLRRHLAIFFRSIEHEPARWLTIVTNGSSQQDNLSRLLGLQYEKMYLPLMQKCGLINTTKSNRYKTVTVNPSIESKNSNGSYTWSDFISEHRLNIELSYIFEQNNSKKKVYFIRCGSFEEGRSRFTILDQIRAAMTFRYNTLRDRQRDLIASLANESFSPLDTTISPPFGETTTGLENAETNNTNSSSAHYKIPQCSETLTNMKSVISNFFEKILKPGANVDKILSSIDENKLMSGIKELIGAVHRTTHEIQTAKLLQVNSSSNVVRIDADSSKHPSIQKFGIPMVNTTVKVLLKDIVSLNEKTSDNLLSFENFNGKMCYLVQPIRSSSYKLFKQNITNSNWMDDLLLAVNEDVGLAAEWILSYLGKRFEDTFTEVAVHLGLLLPPKIMDAESACAMWEEANCPYKSQRIILRHLKCFFGRRITVPERHIRELEDGALDPISNEKVIDGKNVFFWHKDISEVVVHRIKLELKHRGPQFLSQYNVLDVVLGGDHGARRFRAAVKLIFRRKDQPDVKTTSIILQVGHIDTAKDTYEILQQTLAQPLNEGMHRIINKFACVHQANVQGGDPIVTLAPERPDTNNRCIAFAIRCFIAGDLAFFATILGKPNMSPCWCTWCQLSKMQWSVEGHGAGLAWTVEKLLDIRNNVEFNGLAEKPDNIFGCTHKPLFDAVPVENYIISILHIIIGVGNTLVDILFDWVEWRMERLTPAEVTQRNAVLYAEIALRQATKRHENWKDNEGSMIGSKVTDKKRLQKELSAKVYHCL